MNEAEVLINQINTTYSGNAWHGTNIVEALKDIDYIKASRRVLASRHTIWELVDHMTVWLEVPVKIYQKKRVHHNVPIEENWKPMGSSQEDWEKTTKRLEKAVEELISVLKEMPLGVFDEKVLNHDFNYRNMFYGALNHNLYHLGQISILKPPNPQSPNE